MTFHKNVSLLALAVAGVLACGTASAAGTASSTLTVDATLVAACEVSPTSQIHFGNITALASIADVDANSGSTFQVACTNGLAPVIYAAALRSMSNGTDSLAFNLSLTSGGTDDLANAQGSAQPIAITQDGTMQDVVLYGRVLSANFASLPAGTYTGNVSVSVFY